MLANPGAGHFDLSNAKVAYLALYLEKAVRYRLPAGDSAPGPLKLNLIDPTISGWLADRWHKDAPPKALAAPVGQYTGDPKDAFWYFDGELARATEALEAMYRGKKTDLVGYVQNGKVVAQNPSTHQQVTLSFEPLQDGLSFKLSGTFLNTVLPGRPEGWTGLPKGTPINHATGGGPIVISRICGPVEQTGPDTWAVRFYRMGMTNQKRSNEIWLIASHPGDQEYRPAVQQAVLHFPLRNDSGTEQHILFDKIPDQKVGVRTFKLHATSDANVPVLFYVREGPAELDHDTLTFTAIPPRAKFPVRVTVVAWQWGRSIEPRLKTAQPVERTFALVK